MTKRKGKSASKQDDSSLLLEPTVEASKGVGEYVYPSILLLILVFGGVTVGWFCSQQQQTIDNLSETLSSMQLRVTKFQQQLGLGNAQLSTSGGFEERLVTLEEAYSQTQKQAEVALSLSESTDLRSQVWGFHSEVNAKLAELQQMTLSAATLQASLKNQSQEFEAIKQSVGTILSANSELAGSIARLTRTLTTTNARLDDQATAVDSLVSQLEGQGEDLMGLRESLTGHQDTIQVYAKEVLNMKLLVESAQTKRAKILKDQLSSVRKSLEEQQVNAQNLHFHLSAQLEAVQTQLLPVNLEEEQEALETEEVQTPEESATDEREEPTSGAPEEQEEPEEPEEDVEEPGREGNTEEPVTEDETEELDEEELLEEILEEVMAEVAMAEEPINEDMVDTEEDMLSEEDL